MGSTRSSLQAAPFGVADLVQILGIGRRSVYLDVCTAHGEHGGIVVVEGELWDAHDAYGHGFDAFCRLVSSLDPNVKSRPLHPEDMPPERTIVESCESALLEAARRRDEERESGVLPHTESTTAEHHVVRMPQAEEVVAVTRRPQRPSPAALEKGFEELYERGVEALLARRFDDAFDAFARADFLRPGDRRIANNLKRLTEMGHAR